MATRRPDPARESEPRPADTRPSAATVAAVRRFNRAYTRHIGALDEGHAQTRFNLAEARVLWELAHRDRVAATELSRELGLDRGYLSRLLQGFRRRRLVRAEPSPHDARQRLLTITPTGRRAYAPLESHTEDALARLLAPLGPAQQAELVAAMARIDALLAPAASSGARAWVLRAPRAGDLGWVVARHGALYAQEHGWDLRFEAEVARIAARYVEHHDPARDAGWIAERDGQPLGCVFLVQARDDQGAALEGTAQLRMLLVEPAARGQGIGARLVAECERAARGFGYRRIVLSTHSLLVPARTLYRQAGYRLVASEPHPGYGHPLTAETWALDLAAAA